MSATAQPGTAPPGAYGPPGWAQPPFGWTPWTMVWSLPKPVLILGVVLAFMLFWPIGLAVLFFLLGTGRICSGRWARRNGQGGSGWARSGGGGGGCGWQGWQRQETTSSGNAAFDEYRQDTLRRLEEEQKDFAAFLERLRFAKDKAEFDQFMTERRPRPPAPAASDEPAPQG